MGTPVISVWEGPKRGCDALSDVGDGTVTAYPVKSWEHIRTTNPVESTFTTDWLRTQRSRNCGSRRTTLAMVLKLLQSAEKRWKRIKGFKKLALVVNNARFQDGEQLADQADRNVA